MASLGDALTLYDVGLRVAAFINDLRHAQDDFLGLRAEANCLQVCLNSLCSESCQETIYKYISQKQRSDLELILENTLLNMEDLNRFLGGCKYLVANEAKKLARERGMKDKWKAFWKKAWASYKFVTTDPQPFRDKLVIPTQSLQIFLHSMTHVGLANVGNLLALSGHLPNAVDNTAPGPSVRSWEAIGTKLAFKKAKSLGMGTLTSDLEEEIIRYVLHLQKGGQPFDAKDTASFRPRSKSRGSISYAKDKKSETYIVRKRTAYVSSPRRTSPPVKDTSWSRVDRMPLRLDIPPPSPGARSPLSPSSPRIVDARPDFQTSSDEEVLPSRRSSFSGVPQTRRQSVTPEPRPAQPPTSVHSRYTMHGFTDVKFTRRDCRKKVEDEIKLEQEEAAKEIRDASIGMRSRRRTRMSGVDPRASIQDEDSESEEIIELLAEQYGLRIERLPVDRPPIDNGTVVPVLPASLVEPDEPVEAPIPTILPKRGARLTSETSFYDNSFRTKRSRYSRPYETGRETFVNKSYQGEWFRRDQSASSEEPNPKRSAPNVVIYDHDEEKRLKPQVHQQHKRSASYGGTEYKQERPVFIVRRHSQGPRDDLSPKVDTDSESS